MARQATTLEHCTGSTWKLLRLSSRLNTLRPKARGVVTRDSNDYDVSPEAYAKALWRNGWRRADGGKKPYLLTVLQEHTDAMARR